MNNITAKKKKTWKRLKYLCTGESHVNPMCVYSVECDLAIRRDKLGMQATMRRNLKHITQIQEVMKTEKRSEVSIGDISA